MAIAAPPQSASLCGRYGTSSRCNCARGRLRAGAAGTGTAAVRMTATVTSEVYSAWRSTASATIRTISSTMMIVVVEITTVDAPPARSFCTWRACDAACCSSLPCSVDTAAWALSSDRPAFAAMSRTSERCSSDRMASRSACSLAHALLDRLVERGLADHMILRTGQRRHEQDRQTNCEQMPNDSHLQASVNNVRLHAARRQSIIRASMDEIGGSVIRRARAARTRRRARPARALAPFHQPVLHEPRERFFEA